MSTSPAQVMRELANFYIDSAAHCRSPLMFNQLLRLAADYSDRAAQIERGSAGPAQTATAPKTDNGPSG